MDIANNNKLLKTHHSLLRRSSLGARCLVLGMICPKAEHVCLHEMSEPDQSTRLLESSIFLFPRHLT